MKRPISFPLAVLVLAACLLAIATSLARTAAAYDRVWRAHAVETLRRLDRIEHQLLLLADAAAALTAAVGAASPGAAAAAEGGALGGAVEYYE